MADAVATGHFREDLFYRLNVFPLLIPALRQRGDDIAPLARHFLAEHGLRAGRPGLRLSAAAEAALRQHAWPGNVRELENVMQRAVILAPGDRVEIDSLHLAAAAPLAPSAAPRREMVAPTMTVAASPAAASESQQDERSGAGAYTGNLGVGRRLANSRRAAPRDVGADLAPQVATVSSRRFSEDLIL
jgi:two-component system response regulator FlrC